MTEPDMGRLTRDADPGTMLSILVPHLDSGYRLRQCIRSIEESPPDGPYELIVVDNGSRDGSTGFLQGGHPHVQLIETAPRGYVHAANLAFSKARGDTLLMLNPDIRFEPGTLRAMQARLRSDQALGGVAAYYVRPDGSFHRYYNAMPSPWACFVTLFAPRWLATRSRSYRRYHLLDVDFEREVVVPQPAGACLLVRRDVFGGEFMSRVFGMFWSDVEVAAKIAAKGLSIVVAPQFRVTHDHDETTRSESDPRRWLFAGDLYVGAVRFFSLYGPPGSAIVTRVLFALGLASGLAATCARAVARRRPWSDVKAKGRLLRDLLRSHNPLLDDGVSLARTA